MISTVVSKGFGTWGSITSVALNGYNLPSASTTEWTPEAPIMGTWTPQASL